MAADFLLLGGASIVSQAIGFLVLTFVARRVGPANLGAYGVAVALTAYLQIPVAFGVTMLAIRDVAQDRAGARQVVQEVLAIQGALGLASYLLLLLLTPAIAPTEHARELLPIVGLAIVSNALSLDWTLQGLERFRPLGVLRLGSQLIYAALALPLVTDGFPGTRTYAWLNLLSIALVMIGSQVVVW